MRSPLLPALAATASLAAVPAGAAILDLSSGSATEFGVTVTIVDGDLTPFVTETLLNPNLISLFDGDDTVTRISASGGSDEWNITVTDPGVLNTKYLLLRDPDLGEDWRIETAEDSGIAPAGIVYLGGADDDDDEALSITRYPATSFNAVTGLFTAGDSVGDDYFVFDITAVTGSFFLDPTSGGTQWAVFVGDPIPEPGTLALVGLGAAAMLSRRPRSSDA